MPVAPNPLAIEKLRAKVPVGSVLNSAEWADTALAIREASMFSSEIEKLRFLQRTQERLEQAVAMLRRPGMGVDGGEGAFQTREKFVDELRKIAREEGLDPRNDPSKADRFGGLQDPTSVRRLRLIYDHQVESAQEYARWKAEQDPDVMAAFPAQEFVRVESRRVPRTNWKERWLKAGGEPREDGRMVALKGDPVWRKLSRFGTPWPPFDFSSGMGLRDIRRAEAEALGLIKPGDAPELAEVGFNADLKASVADMKPEYRRLLSQTFGERIVFEGDTVRWIPSEPDAVEPGEEESATQAEEADPEAEV